MSKVQGYIDGLIECINELSPRDIEEAVDIIIDAWKKGRQVFVMGNGGSATTAGHFARDLQIGTASPGKPRVRAISLADSVACITSLGNDIDYNAIFEEQLVGQMQAGDVVIGITCSGNSPNVLKAIEYAGRNGATTIGIIGFGGGRLKDMVHKSIVLSSRDYRPLEDVHLGVAHMISYLVEERIAND
jgi:D-sedoheptulose 7-phosphate isomerase